LKTENGIRAKPVVKIDASSHIYHYKQWAIRFISRSFIQGMKRHRHGPQAFTALKNSRARSVAVQLHAGRIHPALEAA
jgi:hypothetical protein